MSSIANQVAALPQMLDGDIVKQPPEVWRCVEDAIEHGWHFKAKSAWSMCEMGEPAPPAPGWLRLYHIEPLNALDVPVSRMFTGCALAQRREVSRG